MRRSRCPSRTSRSWTTTSASCSATRTTWWKSESTRARAAEAPTRGRRRTTSTRQWPRLPTTVSRDSPAAAASRSTSSPTVHITMKCRDLAESRQSVSQSVALSSDHKWRLLPYVASSFCHAVPSAASGRASGAAEAPPSVDLSAFTPFLV